MNETSPVRMCVICKTRFAKKDLERHVRDDNGILILDAEQTRPGRGWYICNNEKCRTKFEKFRPGSKKSARKCRRAK